jgi:hypothetical protein
MAMLPGGVDPLAITNLFFSSRRRVRRRPEHEGKPMKKGRLIGIAAVATAVSLGLLGLFGTASAGAASEPNSGPVAVPHIAACCRT